MQYANLFFLFLVFFSLLFLAGCPGKYLSSPSELVTLNKSSALQNTSDSPPLPPEDEASAAPSQPSGDLPPPIPSD